MDITITSCPPCPFCQREVHELDPQLNDDHREFLSNSTRSDQNTMPEYVLRPCYHVVRGYKFDSNDPAKIAAWSTQP